MQFGEKVKSMRKAKGLVKDQLSRKTGITFETINRIENGRGLPYFGTIQLLAKGLDCTLEELFKDVE